MTNDKIKVAGRFYASIVRDGEVIYKDEIGNPNIVVNEGLNHMMATEFNQGTVIPTWYIGIYTTVITPLATDTAAGIVARAGESSAYDEANRIEWVEVTDAANNKVTNDGAAGGTEAVFTISAGITVQGAFLISSAGKGSATGTLMAVANFTAARALVDNDQLIVTYEIAATST